MRTQGKHPMMIALSVCFAICMTLLACQGGGDPTPTPTATPDTSRHFMTIQFCNQTTSGLKRQDFTYANQLMAKSLLEAVSANQKGFVFYTNAMNGHTLNPQPGDSLQPIIVPAIPAMEPNTPPSTPVYSNYVSKNKTATAFAIMASATETAVANADAQIAQQIDAEKATLQPALDALTKWNPPVSVEAQSVIGCLQLAAYRFQNQSGPKLIYISSNLDNTTTVDITDRLFLSKELNGAIVRVLNISSVNGPSDHTKRTGWCELLQKAGAASISFDDPDTSYGLLSQSDLFSHDITMPQGCPTF